MPFAIELQGLTYGCRFEPRPGSKRLVVVLNAATGPSLTRPVFNGRKLGKPARAHLLVISDPGLLLDENLRAGVFLGTLERDPILDVVAIVKALASQIEAKRIIFWGGSGGGFAAVMAAIRSGTAAVALNPQLDLPKVRFVGSAPILLERFSHGMTADRIGLEHNDRVNAASAFLASRSRRSEPRIALIQNRQDKHHFTEHYQPFCARVGAPMEGGHSRCGSIATLVLDYPGGHSATDEARQAMLDFGLPFCAGRVHAPA